MAGAREIRTQIGSVQNTRKVTRALEMVSASKIRKTQALMQASRPYATMIRRVVGHIAQANPDYRHPFTIAREVKSAGMVIVSTDRGLCGGLNTNLFKRALTKIREWREAGVEVKVATFGSKATQFFSRIEGVELVASATNLGEKPRIEELIGVITAMIEGFSEESLDELHVCYNQFVNAMTQKPNVQQLLPLPPAEDEHLPDSWDYIYEPSAPEVLDEVLKRYVESTVYQSVVENVASEHAARMVAMKAASDNASSLIDELQLIYNKARQAAITQEISEIVSGAAAV